ncbi:hypothetical protein J7T55_008653 [Diaporthe amygdali]|uniref:uncharacterized protein n=1 Tax=Phomopsis amygdali TaxID=1214568 RepID=UPI0022FE1271|nr:uncharacterized protein J7T55_008653 [Diaporthe amygdali]KAJ0121489.1 hypothetical protein J7T55_008653 [Diaporthe amygdali]
MVLLYEDDETEARPPLMQPIDSYCPAQPSLLCEKGDLSNQPGYFAHQQTGKPARSDGGGFDDSKIKWRRRRADRFVVSAHHTSTHVCCKSTTTLDAPYRIASHLVCSKTEGPATPTAGCPTTREHSGPTVT